MTHWSCPTCNARVVVRVPLSAPPTCCGSGKHRTRAMVPVAPDEKVRVAR